MKLKYNIKNVRKLIYLIYGYTFKGGLTLDKKSSREKKSHERKNGNVKPVFHLRKNSHEIKKEDIALVESDVYVTFDQCNVFVFRFVRIFSQVENRLKRHFRSMQCLLFSFHAIFSEAQGERLLNTD